MNLIIIRKYIVGATGLFLCVFLVAHLSANLMLLWPPATASKMYNAYGALLSNNPIIKVVAFLLYASIAAHIIYALLLTIKNKAARGGNYTVKDNKKNSSWASQQMGLLGSLILLFIVIHLANFWARAKLGIGDAVPDDIYGNKDLYLLAAVLFDNIYYAIFYSLMMIPLGYHLYHGLKSALKSLGVYHKSILQFMEKASLVFALIMTIGFGIVPIIMYFK